jgi:hypothetical protein
MIDAAEIAQNCHILAFFGGFRGEKMTFVYEMTLSNIVFSLQTFGPRDECALLI